MILFSADDLHNVENTRIESADFLQKDFPTLIRDRKTICKSIEKETANFLFPHRVTGVRSVALCPIGRERMLGVLAVGNKSQDYFNPDLDTLFLDFIGEVLESIILRRIN